MRTLIEMAREAKMPYDFVTGEPINLEKLTLLILSGRMSVSKARNGLMPSQRSTSN